MRFLTSLDFLTHLDVAELFFSLSFSDSQQAHAPNFIQLISLEVQRACVPSLSCWVQFYSCTFQPIPKWKRNKVCCSWHPICRNIANHEHSSWHAKSFFCLAVFHPCMSSEIHQKQREGETESHRGKNAMWPLHLQSVWGCHPALWFVEVNLFCFSLFTLQRGMFCHPKHTDASQSQVAGSCIKVYRYQY